MTIRSAKRCLNTRVFKSEILSLYHFIVSVSLVPSLMGNDITVILIVCNNRSQQNFYFKHRTCTATCHEGYEFSSKEDSIEHQCEMYSGTWFSGPEVPDCIRKHLRFLIKKKHAFNLLRKWTAERLGDWRPNPLARRFDTRMAQQT